MLGEALLRELIEAAQYAERTALGRSKTDKRLVVEAEESLANLLYRLIQLDSRR